MFFFFFWRKPHRPPLFHERYRRRGTRGVLIGSGFVAVGFHIPVEHPEVFDTNMLGESSWSDPKTSSYHI